MRPEKYILLGYQICKLSGIDINISFCTFVWNIRLLELKSAKQWNLKFMLYLPTPRLLSQIFLKYYSQVSISWKYTIYFEYLLSEVYFKCLKIYCFFTHICAGIREFLQMCQNNGKTPFSSVFIAQYYSPSFRFYFNAIIKFKCTCTCFRNFIWVVNDIRRPGTQRGSCCHEYF